MSDQKTCFVLVRGGKKYLLTCILMSFLGGIGCGPAHAYDASGAPAVTLSGGPGFVTTAPAGSNAPLSNFTSIGGSYGAAYVLPDGSVSGGEESALPSSSTFLPGSLPVGSPTTGTSVRPAAGFPSIGGTAQQQAPVGLRRGYKKTGTASSSATSVALGATPATFPLKQGGSTNHATIVVPPQGRGATTKTPTNQDQGVIAQMASRVSAAFHDAADLLSSGFDA